MQTVEGCQANWCARCTFATAEDAWCAFDFRSASCYHASAHYPTQKSKNDFSPCDERGQADTLAIENGSLLSAQHLASNSQYRKTVPTESPREQFSVSLKTPTSGCSRLSTSCRDFPCEEMARNYLVSTFRVDGNSVINHVNTSQSCSINIISPEWKEETWSTFEVCGPPSHQCQQMMKGLQQDPATASTVEMRDLENLSALETGSLGNDYENSLHANQSRLPPSGIICSPGNKADDENCITNKYSIAEDDNVHTLRDECNIQRSRSPSCQHLSPDLVARADNISSISESMKESVPHSSPAVTTQVDHYVTFSAPIGTKKNILCAADGDTPRLRMCCLPSTLQSLFRKNHARHERESDVPSKSSTVKSVAEQVLGVSVVFCTESTSGPGFYQHNNATRAHLPLETEVNHKRLNDSWAGCAAGQGRLRRASPPSIAPNRPRESVKCSEC